MESEKQSCFTYSLLDLPDEIIQHIVDSLTAAERTRFMAACKRAFHMTMGTAEITLKTMPGCKFSGLRQVLNSLPARIHLTMARPARHFFMSMPHNTELASTCRWENITKLTLQGTNMGCLVPHFFAMACPNLAHLKFEKPWCAEPKNVHLFTTEPGEALPLTVCSSLRKLELSSEDYEHIELPASYHSPEELRHSLPNIDTLIMKFPNATLIEALSTQLTRLEIDYKPETAEQAIRLCSNLQYLRVSEVVLPENTAALKFLEIGFCDEDDDFKKLLELPNLHTLKATGIFIEQDWRGHACPWQELHIESMNFRALANINVSSIKTLRIGPDVNAHYPPPTRPGSLATAQLAANNLAQIGKLTPTQRTADARAYFGECGTLTWDTLLEREDECEQLAAEIIRVVTPCMGPVRVCDVGFMIEHVPPVVAILEWGKEFFESVILGMCHELHDYGLSYHLRPPVWRALQQLSKLTTLVYWTIPFSEFLDEDKPYEMLPIPEVVSNVAQHYVIPSKRGIRIECGLHHREDGYELRPDAQSVLEAAIQEALPAGCKLDSVDFHSMEGNKLYTAFGGVCDTNAFWVVVLAPEEPAQPSAEASSTQHACIINT